MMVSPACWLSSIAPGPLRIIGAFGLPELLTRRPSPAHHHSGAVKQGFHVEGIIEACVDHGIGSEFLGVAEQVVPSFALDDSLVGPDLVTLNSRLCRGQNHFPHGRGRARRCPAGASGEGHALTVHPLYIRGNENAKTPKGSKKNFTGGLGGGRLPLTSGRS